MGRAKGPGMSEIPIGLFLEHEFQFKMALMNGLNRDSSVVKNKRQMWKVG